MGKQKRGKKSIISRVVTDNSAMSEESAASSQELKAQAQALNELIGKFHI